MQRLQNSRRKRRFRLRLRNIIYNHATHIGWYLYTWCARKEQYLLYDLFKAFDKIDVSQKLDFFLLEKTYFCLREQNSSIITI